MEFSGTILGASNAIIVTLSVALSVVALAIPSTVNAQMPNNPGGREAAPPSDHGSAQISPPTGRFGRQHRPPNGIDSTEANKIGGNPSGRTSPYVPGVGEMDRGVDPSPLQPKTDSNLPPGGAVLPTSVPAGTTASAR